jgi:hypothetical protein
LEYLSDALLGLDEGELAGPATFVSAVASATFFRGDVGLVFSSSGIGTSSESATDVRGVNNRDARGVEVLPEVDLVIVSVDAFRLSIGTMRTVAVDPSLGCDACPGLVMVGGLFGWAEVGSLASGVSIVGAEGLAGSAGAGTDTDVEALPICLVDGVGGTFGVGGMAEIALVLVVPRVDVIDTGLPSARVVTGLVTASRLAAGLLAPARARLVEVALFADACEAAEIRRRRSATGTARPGPVLCGPTLLPRLVVDTLDSDEVVRTRGDDAPVVDGAVWNEVDVSLSGERPAVGEVGDSADTADGGERCDFRRVECDVVDRPEATERMEDTDGANDLGRPAGGVRLSDASAPFVGAFFEVVIRDSPAERRIDFVKITGADGGPLVRTEAMELRLEASEFRALASPLSVAPVLAALRPRTLARSEGAATDSVSFAVRNVDTESVRMAVFRFGIEFVAGAGARRSSTGISSSENQYRIVVSR